MYFKIYFEINETSNLMNSTAWSISKYILKYIFTSYCKGYLRLITYLNVFIEHLFDKCMINHINDKLTIYRFIITLKGEINKE